VNTKTFVFSASSFKEYLQCGLKFKFNRIDKREPTHVASHHRWFGTLVHSLVYTSVSVPGGGRDMPLRDKIDEAYPLTIFDELWYERESSNETVQEIRKSLGEKPVGRFMSGKIVSLGKDNPDITQEELDAGWREEAIKMVTNGVAVLKSIPEIVELERKLRWMYHKHRFLGYADVISRDEEAKLGYYDFKTSWDKPGQKLKDDFQFFSYSLALKRLYNLDYYPSGNYVHLRSGDVIQYEVDPDITKKMDKMTKTAFNNLQSDIFFDAYGSPLCRYCDFRHICYGEDESVWKESTYG
jgi:CRISPR/Cas system-associated exonuclease Cas4 (RecB family)